MLKKQLNILKNIYSVKTKISLTEPIVFSYYSSSKVNVIFSNFEKSVFVLKLKICLNIYLSPLQQKTLKYKVRAVYKKKILSF